MEDGVNKEAAKPKEVKCTGKSGWLKKSSRKFLSSYKDRYIQVDRTAVAIYENEELTTCLERLDLENYENCHELKSPFTKKHRLVLIRSPKSSNKVQDVKFQAQTPEEKEAWINALSEGINKAKNKVFDEVKVDESCSLEHVTRSRPKGNRGRRPPTRIHMKEVANVSSDGILRLDLDGDITMQNGTHCLNSEGDKEPEILKPSVTLNDVPEEDVEEDSTHQETVIKPPMPPSKDSKPNDSHKDDEVKSEEPTLPKKVLTPPMPPSKENKPCVSSEKSAADKKMDTEAQGTDISEPTTKNIQSPTPPSKHMKPSQPVTPATEMLEEEFDSEEIIPQDDQKKRDKENQLKTEEVGTFTLSNKILKPQVVMWDSPTIASKEPSVEQDGRDSQKASDITGEVTTLTEPQQLNVTPLATPEPVKKSPGPPAPPKKKPFKSTAKIEETTPQSKPMVPTITPSSEQVLEKTLEKGDITLTTPEPKTEPGVDIISEDLEEKSLDSGQHSGEESEIGDQVTPSTTRLKGSSQGADGETSEDDLDPSDSKTESLEKPSLEISTTTPESPVLNTHPTPSQGANNPQPITVPLKHSFKVRSTSLGDLLSQNTEETEGKEKEIAIKPHGSDVKNLQSNVSFEIAKTEELLNAVEEGASAEILLNAAMEKLRKADEFLREARSFKELDKNKRISL